MNHFRLCLFLLTATFAQIFLLTAGTYGQAPANSKPAAKAILADIIRSKRQSKPFILLTPNDLAGLSPAEMGSLFAGGDPCETAAPIAFGATVNGSLTSSDCRLDDSSYADFYVFTGTQGQQVTVNLSSGAFDTYLGLANETGTFVLEDDNGGGGTNSRIATTLPANGLYVILANSFFPNAFGSYTLSLSACTFTLDPTGADIPGLGGTFSFAMTTQAGCYWGAVSQSSFITVNNSSGHGSATISYTVQTSINGPTRTGTITVGGQVFTVTQTSINCTYSISPTNADHSADPATAQFTINTPAGCPWTAGYNNYWIWTTNETKIGPGPVIYTVAANNGADRTGSITVAGHTFTVQQAGRNCTYSFSPTSFQLSFQRHSGQFTVNTQPGCTWNFSGGYNYVYLPNGYGGTGPGTVEYIIWQNYQFAPRTWTMEFIGLNSTNIVFTQNGFPNRRKFDFDGDGLADLSIWRPSDNNWHIQRTTAGYMRMTYGVAGDMPTPADYDGDLKTDVAVFRPSEGKWYIHMSQSNTFEVFNWGEDGDLPVPADRDADNRADLVIFRPSNNTWYTRFANGTFATTDFGVDGDKPVVGDFDGDGIGDIALFRPSNNNWYILKSSLGYFVQTWGEAGDIPVTGDFDGDGSTDQAVFRPSTGQWYLSRTTGGFGVQTWGEAGDIPVAADYDNDGKTDVAVFRPSNATWYIVGATGNIRIRQFGEIGDVPTQSSYVY